MAKIGRNDPCSCGSGKKYKKCCANNKGSALIKQSKIHFQPREKRERQDKDATVIKDKTIQVDFQCKQ